MIIDLHDRIFRPISNSENGETSGETIFHYRQEGNIVTSEYSGGLIKKGHLMGLMDESGHLTIQYHQVNERGELMAGLCHSRLEILPDGKIRYHESWEWTTGDGSKGNSIIEEL